MNNKMAINTCLSTITLNANGLSAAINRHMDNEARKDTHRLKVKELKKVFHVWVFIRRNPKH